MRRLILLLIINLFAFQIFATDLVLIPTKNFDETKAIFRNPSLTVNFYRDEFVIATLDGILEVPFVKLDDTAWESNFSYYLIYLDDVYRTDYLADVESQVEILFDGGQYLILKTDETVFGQLKPAKNDGMLRISDFPVSLPTPSDIFSYFRLDPDPFVVDLIGQVSSTIITATVQHLQDYGTRNCYQPASVDAQNWIKGQFENMGLPVEVMDFSMPGGAASDNIIATKIGTLYPNEFVVLGGHYDSYSYSGGAPGADDNASGTAGVLEAARILSSYDFDRTIIFCAFSGEEYGLYGSKAYANRCAQQGMNILGYFNMDMIGYLKPGNPIRTDIIYPASALPLAQFYEQVCSVYLPDFIIGSGTLSGGDSDHTSFNNAGFMGIFPFEDRLNYSPYIHTSNDVVGLSYNNAVQAGIFTKATIASVATLAKISETVIWTGNTSTDWNTDSNWSTNAVPTVFEDVNIPSAGITNFPVITSATSANCNNLTVESGAILTVSSGGSFITNGSISGNITIERSVTGSSNLTLNKYHLVSIPLATTNNSLSSLFDGSYLFEYLPATMTWNGLGSNTNTTLNETVGYMIYYPGENHTFQFTGLPNTGIFSPTVTWPGLAGNNNFALVPNPYPSNIDWNAAKGWTKTRIGASIWFYNNGNYGVWNGTSGTNGASRYIAVGQAFFVQTTAAGPSLIMNNSVRTHTSASFLKEGNAVENQLRVAAIANEMSDELLVGFSTSTSNNYDSAEDAVKLYGSSGAPQIYTLASEISLSINNLGQLDGVTSIPMGFECDDDGQYILNFSQMDSFDAGTTIFLTDEITNTTVNLRNQQIYGFVHSPANNASRFTLVFGGAIGIEENASHSGNLWIYGKTLYISAPKLAGQNGLVEVFDPSGQMLMSKTIVLSEISTMELDAKGFLVAKLTTGQEVMTVKGFVKK